MKCIEPDCPNPVLVKVRMLCRLHYVRLQRIGPLSPLPENYRFWSQVSRDDADGCWRWTGHINRDGYGTYNGIGAYRIAYQISVGPVPAGMDVDHLCRVHACVNPQHLQIRDSLENQRDNGWRERTHCINGHEWSAENTAWRQRRGRNGRMHRVCRACDRDRHRKAAQP